MEKFIEKILEEYGETCSPSFYMRKAWEECSLRFEERIEDLKLEHQVERVIIRSNIKKQ